MQEGGAQRPDEADEDGDAGGGGQLSELYARSGLFERAPEQAAVGSRPQEGGGLLRRQAKACGGREGEKQLEIAQIGAERSGRNSPSAGANTSSPDSSR